MQPGTDVLLVIPTLGDRVDYLQQTIESMLSQDPRPLIRVVVPATRPDAIRVAREAGAEVLDDPGSLPAAINLGLQDLPIGIALRGLARRRRPAHGRFTATNT